MFLLAQSTFEKVIGGRERQGSSHRLLYRAPGEGKEGEADES